MTNKNTRIEKDSMGNLEVPFDAMYGANTQRAELNFPISNLKLSNSLINAITQIKYSAAKVNMDLGLLDQKVSSLIQDACKEILNGEHYKEFVVDVFQTGSGTSTNMNVNEVISNIAIKSIDGNIGSRDPVHPNDHVNKGQSSNDVIPTAIHIASSMEIKNTLIPSLKKLSSELEKKSREFWPIIKTGRTHLQDATPIRLGQEFEGYKGQIELGIERSKIALRELSALALGGTAVGTGVGMHPDFAKKMIRELNSEYDHEFEESPNHFQSQNSLDGLVQASGCLKTIAVSLMKIANDIRWLGSGPRAGIGEIELPEVQPGSSIMPGKVNPVIAESVTMVSAQVIGNDTTIAIAGQSGNFELNVMMPVAAYNILQSIELLSSSALNFSEQCISGLKATENGPNQVKNGLAICTALAPIIGYDNAANIAHIASKTGESIFEVAIKETDLSKEELEKILDPEAMTESKK